MARTKRPKRFGLALVAALLTIGVGAVGAWRGEAVNIRGGVAQQPVYAELGQFAAPIDRVDGTRGFLLVQARAGVLNQSRALELSAALPAARHGALSAIYALAAEGEAELDIERASSALKASLNEALGAELVERVYIDRLLVQ